MSEQKEKDSVPQENRPFIRETVMNGGPQLPFWRKLLQTALLAVCFGLIAGAAFHFTHTKLFPQDASTAPSVSFPQETEPPETTAPPLSTESLPAATMPPDEAAWQQAVQNMIADHNLELKDYQRMAVLINSLSTEAQWSLVTVTATNQDNSLFQVGHRYETQSFGVIVAMTAQEVLILTPFNATAQLSDSSTLQVGFANLETADAYIKARDGVLDLMVMAVNRAKVSEQTLSRIKAINLGNSYVSYAGQPVVAMGAPIGGIIKSYNHGILTFVENNFSAPDTSLSLLHTNLAGDKAARGFLINLEGSLIGWIEPAYMSGGTLTAIGISDLRAYIEALSNGTQGCYLGIEGITLSNDLKMALGTEASGIYISRCSSASPAQKAGLQSGDLLTSVAGIDIRNLDELRSVLLSLTADQTISVTILRKGRNSYQTLTYDVKLERR
ncbi:MAG: PDZ domain-containing protein [Lachnospiraceae bacterium]|nr:PDZ domain-containing protein [Lachnospiraceae bacterium]